MKKFKSIMGIAAAATAAACLAACGGGSQYGDTTKNIEVAAKDYQDYYLNCARVYRNYVNVADYKGIEVTKVDRSNETVTDEAVDTVYNGLAEEFRNEEDVTEGGKTEKGDEIVMDFTGSIDGKEFEGGASTDYSYTIGSGQFISDLDEGLVGKEANKEYNIDVKFPDDYGNEELNGKQSVFKVTIKKIVRPTNAELNDEFVAAHTSDWEERGYGSGITTVDALKAGIKESIQKDAKEQNNQQVYEEAIAKIVEKSEFKDELPQEELTYLSDTMKSNVKSQYENYGASMGIESFDDYIKQSYGYESEDQFNEYVDTQAKEYLKTKMVTMVIAADNNVNVSADDITQEGNDIALYYGYGSYQELVEQYGQILNAETGYRVVYNKVSEIVTAEAKEVDATQAATSEAASESASESDQSGEANVEGETSSSN